MPPQMLSVRQLRHIRMLGLFRVKLRDDILIFIHDLLASRQSSLSVASGGKDIGLHSTGLLLVGEVCCVRGLQVLV